MQACNPPDIFWPIAMALRVVDRTKFVFDHHDLCPELFRSRFPDVPRLPYRGLLALERRTHRTADHVISTNDSYRDIAIRRSGKAPGDVTVVRTGPDPDKLSRGPAVPRLRRDREFLAAYIGVMGPQDGVDIVVRAASVVIHDMGRDDIAFTLIGSGDCYDELVALRDELKLDGHVEFTGRAPDEQVKQILSTADVGLSPDPKNPLNDVSTMNKTMEYMSFELPVVAFDLRETRVSAADAAVYVTPNDVREYAKAIVDLMDDADTRDKLGRVGRARVRGRAGLVPSGTRLRRRVRPADRRGLRGHSGHRRRQDRGLSRVRYRRVLPAGRRAQAGRRDDRPDRAPRPGRRRCLEPRGRARLGPPGAPQAVDHRPVRSRRPAAAQGQPDAGLQRRAVQLPRAAVGAAGGGRDLRDLVRHRGGAGRLAALGPAALSRFRGMFAFALADTATGELVLARDPLGVKPLFYLRRGDGVVFASELKAIVTALGSELRVDHGALVSSMLYYWVPEQRCAIEGVHKLPAGSWARIRPGAAPEVRPYWQIKDVAEAGPASRPPT